MLEIVRGDIFESGAQALVNPVNCVGVMGKGLAKEFKKRFPDNYKFYQDNCKFKVMRLGMSLVYPIMYDESTKYVVNFPTKYHWRDSSKIEYIEEGLIDLIETVRVFQIISIAIPALGCGLGGLPWTQVRGTICAAMVDLPDAKVMVYPPKE